MSLITPMRLLRIPEPFDHPDLIFESKLDGFRALAQIRGHRCELVSRNGHTFKHWPQLSEKLTHAVRAHSAVLDREICCRESRGTHIKLLFRREWPRFYAFDVLSIEGEDLTALRLLECKRRLAAHHADGRVPTAVQSHLRGAVATAGACGSDLKASRERGRGSVLTMTDAQPRG